MLDFFLMYDFYLIFILLECNLFSRADLSCFCHSWSSSALPLFHTCSDWWSENEPKNFYTSKIPVRVLFLLLADYMHRALNKANHSSPPCAILSCEVISTYMESGGIPNAGFGRKGRMKKNQVCNDKMLFFKPSSRCDWISSPPLLPPLMG